ncbi:hypothetical protein GGR51DRAFT_561677 [Nemania sp. FL0031]|nr:hypothetical protein GGR51DRAFT_561677 [Nemania sp. FL0031]
MVETCVRLGCVPGQHQEPLMKWLEQEQNSLTIVDCFKELRVGRRYASGKLQTPALIHGRRKLEASDELHIEANFGIVFGDQARVQCAIVVLAGYGGAGGAWSGTGSTIPSYASQAGYPGPGGRASNYANEGYSRQGQDGDGQPPQGQDQHLPGLPTTGLPFACPFYRLNPVEHQNCLPLTLSRIGDVRQHIKRRHIQPIFCPRCGSIFQDNARRDAHMESCRANLNPPAPAGMTPEQLTDMNNAARRRDPNPAARWYEIWDIMSHNQERPSSPYVDVAAERRRIGTHAAIQAIFAQYRQSGNLLRFSFNFFNGVDMQATLGALLDDILDFNDHRMSYPGNGNDGNVGNNDNNEPD